ncbi:jouberin-like isoform X1 [Formica exsecta]|uniref:jouberin-like isoform X1 n=1 Tax=Formica exsecta TaxID=72781 RepID=UPI001144E580|nr:jouberin-like isoform X1 [Formica exsecta]
MAKSAESTRGRKLRRSRNVSSFLEESTESATSPPKATMSVVVDVHSENSSNRQQRNDENGLAIELSDDKETKHSSQSSKVSSRASEASWNRSADRGARRRRSSNDRSHRSHDEVMTIVSLDLIEESGNRNDSHEEKPRRRKQWNAATNETEMMDSKRPPRKRWSKDTGIIRLPETSDDASPLIDDSQHRKVPVPAPRTNNVALVFDNPAFVSEDEVLRIETDHNRESTRIEMGRMGSDRSNIDEAGSTSGSSSRKQRQSERHIAMNSDSRSSRTTRFEQSLNDRKNSVGELDLSTSLGRVTDEVRSSSMEDRTLTSGDGRLQSETTTRDRSSRGGERSLFEKKNISVDDKVISLSAAKDTIDPMVKKKRRKKRKQEKEETREDESRYISVTIHRANMLEDDYANVKRPMVMVHIVETRTGSYLKNGNAYLRPLITGKFDFRENRSMIPVWEEELVFEHDFDAILKREDSDRTVILFEVIDLLSFAEASLVYDRIGSEGCWNKIAWAFLKPVGFNNMLHTDKKVRLQLYRPRRSSKRYGKHTCEVYTWWQSNKRDKYPSSLLVTVTSVPSSKHESVLYQQLPLNDLLDDAHNDSRRGLSMERRTSESTIGLPKWARLAAQSCKIPNKKMFETEASENGCFYVTFSNDGKYLACVHSEEYNYPIIVYEIETGKIHVRFLGHKTFVYSLNWSSDDYHLLSASADQTARIWDIRNQIVQHIEMLPHPSYVYCARYAPGKMTIVATGCYDGVVRIWANENGISTKRELNQELEGHEGFVSSMIFQKNGNLITADSVGSIILWTVRRNGRMSSRWEWCVARRIKIREIEGVVINTIVLHPLESRLLVHSRDNGLRMMDLATGVILQKYKQLNNQRIQLRACISPCGGLILCGGEDSVLNIWNLETGKHVAKYADGRSSSRAVITCVDYHPYDHVLAFSIFGNPTSVRVLRFNKNANGSDVGLNLFTEEPEDMSRVCDNEVIMNVLEYPLSQQGKSSGGTTVRKEIFSSSCRPANDHTMIQIENDDCERSWMTLRRLKEMERCWREKSRNRLHCIIEKIDSMLSKSSMFFEDEGERISSRINERRRSWIRSNTSTSSDIVPKGDILLEDCAANSIRYHQSDPNENNKNARSDSASRQICSDSRKTISASLEKTNTLELSSPDSAGTYVVEMPNLNENVNKVSFIAEKMNSIQLSDSSLASNVTFIIENERT